MELNIGYHPQWSEDSAYAFQFYLIYSTFALPQNGLESDIVFNIFNLLFLLFIIYQ